MTVLRPLAYAPTWALTGPPLILAVAIGLTAHRFKTRKNVTR